MRLRAWKWVCYGKFLAPGVSTVDLQPASWLFLTSSGEGQHWTSPGHAHLAVTEHKGYYGIFPGRRQYRALRKQHLVLNYGKSLNQVEVELEQHFQTSFIQGTSYAEVLNSQYGQTM